MNAIRIYFVAIQKFTEGLRMLMGQFMVVKYYKKVGPATERTCEQSIWTDANSATSSAIVPPWSMGKKGSRKEEVFRVLRTSLSALGLPTRILP